MTTETRIVSDEEIAATTAQGQKIVTQPNPDPAAIEKAKSDKYLQELRRVIQARVRREDGTLGEPGALPQEELVSHYQNKPLKSKE